MKAETTTSKGVETTTQYVGLPKGISPESIFYYIYAILHSPSYRSRYAAFLKIDFPRIPLPGSESLFRALSDQGSQLVNLHLMDSPLGVHASKVRHGYPVIGNSMVGPKFPKFINNAGASDGRIYINETQYFDSVPLHVWQFKIGGYQVAEKWLKDRRERSLTGDERAHYQRILTTLADMQLTMCSIEQAIEEHGGWPDAFSE